MDFSRDTAGNNNAQDKIECLEALSAERGIVMHKTNISPEQVKAQLPVFTGTSSLSVVDAVDTWSKALTNAGIHKQMWAGFILCQVQNPAISSILPYAKREMKFEDICSALKTVYGGAMKASENIMNAHIAAGQIPEPFQQR